MHIRKMHACGNDFLLIEAIPYVDYSSLAIKLCERRLGIGADGLIVMKLDPLEMICFQQDGSRIPMNANAIRCVAMVAAGMGLTRRNKLEIITGIGIVEVLVNRLDPFSCTVSMGKPFFNNSMLNVTDELECFGRTLSLGNRFITTYSLFIGTVNTIIFVDDFDAPAIEIASEISNYELFTKGTNVNYVSVMNNNTIKVKTYEKGIGFVLSSGSGCVASMVAAAKLGYIKTKAKVFVDLGQMEVEITKKGIVNLTGDAKEVFSLDYTEE